MAKRAIIERDLRMPEFADCELTDLERREDGTIARKDRWENGLRTIASIVGFNPRETFEVADVVQTVREIMASKGRTAHAPADGPERED